jgi:hypothetical protein
VQPCDSYGIDSARVNQVYRGKGGKGIRTVDIATNILRNLKEKPLFDDQNEHHTNKKEGEWKRCRGATVAVAESEKVG